MKIFLFYLLILNIFAYILMFADKRKAIKNKWRIPERVLILSALLGGSVGALLGMYVFHHKTQKNKFRIGIPAILILQILIALALICLRNGVWEIPFLSSLFTPNAVSS